MNSDATEKHVATLARLGCGYERMRYMAYVERSEGREAAEALRQAWLQHWEPAEDEGERL